MNNIRSINRFIDYGSGTFRGTRSMFTDWINRVNTLISTYGLYVDEDTIKDPG